MAPLAKREGSQMPGIAFVTGGARGLGNAVAVAFAKEGSRGVVIVDVGDEATLQSGREAVEAYGTECLAIKADVTNEDELETAVAKAIEQFGRIDYAANFAGIAGAPEGVMGATLDGFKKTLDVNCTGVFLSTKVEMNQMMKQSSLEVEEGRVPQKGAIVNCASINSIMAVPGGVGYTTAKHAVNGITKTGALEGRKHNIRVNSISPGFLLTGLVTPNLERDGFKVGVWEAAIKRQGREATFNEIGDATVLLCSPKMSLVNAHNLVIDNGFTCNEMNF